jgi:diguanylate cyclase (GGDEF)-like protein
MPNKMNFNILQWRSLKTRVTVFTLAIFLISLWSLAFYASQALRNDVRSLLSEQQFSTVSFIAVEVNQALNDRFNVLEKAAGRVSLATLDHPATLQAFLEERLILQGPFNGGIFVTQVDGTAIAGLPRSAEWVGVSYLDRDYIVSAIKGKATVGRPVIDRVLQAPIFVMAAPIRDPQGAVIGALAGVTNLNQPNFLDRLTHGRYGQSGGYVLISPQHRLVVTASDKSRIMQTLPTPGVNPGIDRFLDGYEGSAMVVNPLGVEVLASGKSVPATGWIAVAALPTAEAFAPIHAMQERMWITMVLLTLLAGGLTWWMLRHQLSPMLDAVRTLAAWSDTHQPPQPLPMTRQDEIGELIGGFNRLLSTLAQRENALIESERLLKQLALYDPLTQLPNRRLLNDRLNQTMITSKRSGCHVALMFLDLDHFKPLNDTHGHAVGDLLLIEVANRLKSCIRGMDTIARFGGDEFVVMLSELNVNKAQSMSQAEVVAEKIRFALSEPYWLTVKRDGQTDNTVEHHCTASIGIVVFMNHQGSLDDVLKWADQTMYQAKEAGRNRIRFYDMD